MSLICRTCSQTKTKFLHLFKHYYNNNLISEMLIECTPVEIKNGDGLPSLICSECLDNLISAWHFRRLTIESDSELRKFVFDNKSWNKSTDDDIAIVKEENINDEAYDSMKSENLYVSDINDVDLNDKNALPFMKNDEYNSSSSTITACNETENAELIVNANEHINNMSQEVAPIEVQLNINNDNFKEKYINCKNEILPSENVEQPINTYQSQFSSTGIDGNTNSEVVLPKYEKQYNQLNIKGNFIILGPYRKLTREEKKKTFVSCNVCNKTFGYYYFHQVHVRQHKGDLQHKCKTCGESFAIPSLLKAHEVKHSDARPFVCDICGKSFKLSNALQKHKRSHSNGKLYKCDVCLSDFKSEITLKMHAMRHTSKKEHMCETCGKTFINTSELHSHLKIHSGIKSNYTCKKCNTVYPDNNKLRNHVRQSHMSAKRYACTQCDKRFKDKSVMKRHLMIHTGERPYSCKVCGKSFRQSTVLRTHMRSHTGETPYACKLCPLSFKYRQELNKHMKKLHK